MSSQTFSLGNVLAKITDPKKIARESQLRINQQNEPRKPKPLAPLPEITTWEEAREARHHFENMMGDATQASSPMLTRHSSNTVNRFVIWKRSSRTIPRSKRSATFSVTRRRCFPNFLDRSLRRSTSKDRWSAFRQSSHRSSASFLSANRRLRAYEQIRQQLAPWRGIASTG